MSATAPAKAKAASPRPQLHERKWAVIGAHYFNDGLTHAEAAAEAADLTRRKQRGFVVTEETARRLVELAINPEPAAASDMRF